MGRHDSHRAAVHTLPRRSDDGGGRRHVHVLLQWRHQGKRHDEAWCATNDPNAAAAAASYHHHNNNNNNNCNNCNNNDCNPNHRPSPTSTAAQATTATTARPTTTHLEGWQRRRRRRRGRVRLLLLLALPALPLLLAALLLQLTVSDGSSVVRPARRRLREAASRHPLSDVPAGGVIAVRHREASVHVATATATATVGRGGSSGSGGGRGSGGTVCSPSSSGGLHVQRVVGARHLERRHRRA
jgi:hypothetical protein